MQQDRAPRDGPQRPDAGRTVQAGSAMTSMRRACEAVFLGMATTLTIAAGAYAQQNTDATGACAREAAPYWQPLVPGVWVRPGLAQDIGAHNGGQVASQLLIGQGNSATLVDPGPSLAQGLAARRAARCELGLAITRVLDSHAHAENVLGNAAFEAEQVRLEALPETRAAMAARCPKCLAAMVQALGAEPMAGTRIVLPQPSLQAGQDWDSDAGAWQALEFRWAHTESDLALWNERHRLLVAPGLVYHERLPELAQGSVVGWIAALETLRSLRPDWVVGNLPLAATGPQAVDGLGQTHRYLCSLSRAVLGALDSGRSVTEVQQIGLPAYAGWAGYAQRNGFNVQRAWRELEPLWIRDAVPACELPE